MAWDFANSKVDKNELIKSCEHELTDNGTPLLNGCLASMECSVKEMYEGGDHTIFVGQIENGTFDENAEPMVYYSSGLGKFTPNQQ